MLTKISNIDRLHPNIIAFWERKGLKVMTNWTESSPYQVWNLYEGIISKYTVAVTYADQNKSTRYFLKNRSYSEQEMLKLIKLKAFW